MKMWWVQSRAGWIQVQMVGQVWVHSSSEAQPWLSCAAELWANTCLSQEYQMSPHREHWWPQISHRTAVYKIIVLLWANVVKTNQYHYEVMKLFIHIRTMKPWLLILYQNLWHVPVEQSASEKGIQAGQWYLQELILFTFLFHISTVTSEWLPVSGSWKPGSVCSAQKCSFPHLSWEMKWSFKSEINCVDIPVCLGNWTWC